MFRITADQYDLAHASKDCEGEAHRVARIIRDVDPNLHTVLDVACGTGQHDGTLSQMFAVDGLDLSPEFIEFARQRNPSGRYVRGDMRDFRLDRLYDVVICLFSSIAYARGYDELHQSLTCFREHLTPTGIAVVEPFFTPCSWQAGCLTHHINVRDGQTLVRMGCSAVRGSRALLHFHYLIGTAEGIEHVEESHEISLFTEQEMRDAFAEAGFASVKLDAEGLERGLYIARNSAV